MAVNGIALVARRGPFFGGSTTLAVLMDRNCITSLSRLLTPPPFPDASPSSVQNGHPGDGLTTACSFHPTDLRFVLGSPSIQHPPCPTQMSVSDKREIWQVAYPPLFLGAPSLQHPLSTTQRRPVTGIAITAHIGVLLPSNRSSFFSRLPMVATSPQPDARKRRCQAGIPAIDRSSFLPRRPAVATPPQPNAVSVRGTSITAR